MGYPVVNWNLGCPFPVVVNKGKGAGMLCYPVAVERFLDRTIPVIKPKLSIKLRTGLAYGEEILALIPIFNRYPLEELIIHPRTGKQMYEGDVDLNVFSKCIDISSHEIVYNGDLDSTEKYGELSGRFPSIKKWMIGRGLLSDPFLACKIATGVRMSREEEIAAIRSFHDELFAEYSKVLSGPAHITDRMKSIWAYLADFFKNSDRVRKRINKAQSVNHYLDAVSAVFDD